MDFFYFFEKMRKCEISEEYNAKRGFEPSKTFDFGIIFLQISSFFPNPLPEAIFGGSRCPSRLPCPIFDRFPIFQGSQNGALARHFRPKRRQKGYPANDANPPGADLGAIWCRKHYKIAFLMIRDRFLSILEGFWTNLG